MYKKEASLKTNCLFTDVVTVIELTLSRTGHTAKKLPTCIVPINFISPFLSSKNIERSFVFDDWGKCKVGAVFILINWIISYLCPF